MPQNNGLLLINKCSLFIKLDLWPKNGKIMIIRTWNAHRTPIIVGVLFECDHDQQRSHPVAGVVQTLHIILPGSYQPDTFCWITDHVEYWPVLVLKPNHSKCGSIPADQGLWKRRINEYMISHFSTFLELWSFESNI